MVPACSAFIIIIAKPFISLSVDHKKYSQNPKRMGLQLQAFSNESNKLFGFAFCHSSYVFYISGLLLPINYIFISYVHHKMKRLMKIFGIDTPLLTWKVEKRWLSAKSYSYFPWDNSAHHTDRTLLLVRMVKYWCAPLTCHTFWWYSALLPGTSCTFQIYTLPFSWLYSFVNQNTWPSLLERTSERWSIFRPSVFKASSSTLVVWQSANVHSQNSTPYILLLNKIQ